MSDVSRRDFIRHAGQSTFGALLAGGLLGSSLKCAQSGLPVKPNIVYILADDMGYADAGCYGQQDIQTPNIDRLCREGMRFTQHYAGHPVCAPSRCTLMTGKHTGHATRRSNRPYVPLKPDEVTVAEILKSAGYTTGAVGKWGLADTEGNFDPGTTGKPNQRGFDYFFGFLNQKHAWDYYTDFVWENEEKYMNVDKRYMHDVFTEKSLNFIRKNHQNPFYLYVPFTLPHVNNGNKHTDEALEVPDDTPYSNEDWPQAEKNYASMVTRIDTSVGQILALLDELNLTENTIVMFASDNGAQNYSPHTATYFKSTGGLRAYKGQVYEGGVRIPFIVKWPGVVQPGSTSDHISAFWDFMPTAADIVGAETPKDIDGISFLPALLGKPQLEHEYLYWEFPGKTSAQGKISQAIRMGDWKSVRIGLTNPIELYNLKTDLFEEKNVADQHPELVAKFAELFKTARTESEHWPLPEK